MNKNMISIIVLVCLVISLSTIAFATANSYIVGDTTTPQGSFALRVEANDNEYVEYPVELEPGRNYTLSFLYKTDAGSMTFRLMSDDEDYESRSFTKRNWNYESYTFTPEGNPGDDPIPYQLRFVGHDGAPAVFWLDGLTLEKAPEPTTHYDGYTFSGFNDFKYEVGCCPYDFCYTGGLVKGHPECVQDDFYEKNVSMPPVGYELPDFGNADDPSVLIRDGKNGYRCINGSWTFSRVKYTPIFDRAGFCPKESQCFRYDAQSVDPAKACVENETFIMYDVSSDPLKPDRQSFYCYNGNWTTRTKEIALQLLHMTTPDDTYTLFCDRFDRSLNWDQTMSFWRDFVGDNVATVLMSGTVNEFCVLNLNGQIIAGASLNIPANETKTFAAGDCVPGGFACMEPGACNHLGCLQNPPQGIMPLEKSFVELLKGKDDKDYCDSVIRTPAYRDGLYHKCDNGDVYYNPRLQTVIFTKPFPSENVVQVVPFAQPKSFIGQFIDTIKELLQSLLGIAGVPRPVNQLVTAEEFDFVRNAGSMNRLYISHMPPGEGSDLPRDIRGIIETRAHKRLDNSGIDIKSFITIDYFNYKVPVCKYFFKQNLPHLQSQISGKGASGIRCTPVILDDSTWKYSVYVEEPKFGEAPEPSLREWTVAANNFWNDMTAKIRTKDEVEFTDTFAPDTPTFDTAPRDNPVVDVPVDFLLTAAPQEDEYFIAITWDFGDDMLASSIYNITTKHIYRDAKTFSPVVRVMNQYYEIAESDPVDLDINVGAAVTIQEFQQTANGEVLINISFTEAQPPVNFQIDWGDTLSENQPTVFTNFNTTETPWTLVSHSYTFGNVPALDPDITVTGVAGAFPHSAPFDNHKRIIVWQNLASQAFDIQVIPYAQEEDGQAIINISFANVTHPPLVLSIDWRDYYDPAYAPEQVPSFTPPINQPYSFIRKHNYSFADQLAVSPDITVTGRDNRQMPFYGHAPVLIQKNLTT